MFRTWELKLKKKSRDRGVGLLQQYSKHEDILKIGARNTMRQYILKKGYKTLMETSEGGNKTEPSDSLVGQQFWKNN